MTSKLLLAVILTFLLRMQLAQHLSRQMCHCYHIEGREGEREREGEEEREGEREREEEGEGGGEREGEWEGEGCFQPTWSLDAVLPC